MKFRIIEEKVGTQDPTYYIQWKPFIMWVTHWINDTPEGYSANFSTQEEAIHWIIRNYPTRTKIIKEIEVK